MSTKFIKRNFYTTQRYTFESGCMKNSSARYVGGLRPYHQQKGFFSKLSAIPTVEIHTIDDSLSSEISLDKVEFNIRHTKKLFFVFV
jgi:hypothetical protein